MFALFRDTVLLVALLSTGFLFGTDAFFAFVVQRALARADAGNVAEVMGRIHEIADQRVPIIGATALITTLGSSLLTGWGTASGRLALLALLLLVTFLVTYLSYSRPINATLTVAAVQHQTLTDPRGLQQRWDRVIGLRASFLFFALGTLGIAALALH